jgi:hypothetical protein
MPQQSAHECARAGWRANRGAARFSVGLAGYLALASAHCTFPNYDTDPSGGASNGGAAGGVAGSPVGGNAAAQGGAGGAGATAGTGVVGGTAGEGGADPIGGAGECLPEQWPVNQCETGCLRRFPDHCYDGKTSGDEIAIDCGGGCQRCTSDACSESSDCLSDTCQASDSGQSSCFAPLTIHFTSHELNASVGSTAWSITLANATSPGAPGYSFKDLKIRYYFTRGGTVEPLLVRATQSNLRLENGESRELKQTNWTVERTQAKADTVYDAYVEVGFDESGQLLAGDSIDLYQQMLTGDPASSSFDQRANYSFTDQADAAWQHVTVFYQDKLVWGLEPRPANPRACFARGVNLNGPALTIAGNAFQGASQAGVTGGTGVSQGGTPFPVVSGTLATMLQTASRLQAGGQQELDVPTVNGSYLMYLYATSPTNDAAPSVFTVQGVEQEVSSKFRSQATDGGQVWARLGPFQVDVLDGTLAVAVTSGSVTFTGLELWYPE